MTTTRRPTPAPKTGLFAIPEGMAYASIGGFNPVAGLRGDRARDRRSGADRPRQRSGDERAVLVLVGVTPAMRGLLERTGTVDELGADAVVDATDEVLGALESGVRSAERRTRREWDGPVEVS